MPTMINLALSDFDNLPEATAGQIDSSSDFVPILDASGSIIKKAKPNNLSIGEVAGVIKMYGGASAPSGYLFCDGSEVSRSTYSSLYTAIGDAYGAGNGSTTFNLPDFRARVPGGVNHSGLPNGANGSFSTRNRAFATGAETHTLTVSEMPSHSHSGGFTPNGNAQAGGNPSIASSNSTGSAGGDAGHNNMQPTLFCNFIISIGA